MLRLKEFWWATQDKRAAVVDPAAPGGVANFASIDVLSVVGMNGGASADVLCADGTNGGAMACGDVLAAVWVADLSPSLAVIEAFSLVMPMFGSEPS